MKDEMELVQEMENVNDRNIDSYLDTLSSILDVKSAAVKDLKEHLIAFRAQKAKIVLPKF